MTTKIYTAASAIARRDALSPACEKTLKNINDRLIDTEYLRKTGDGFIIVYVKEFLTPADKIEVESSLHSAGYAEIEFVYDGRVVFYISFKIPATA